MKYLWLVLLILIPLPVSAAGLNFTQSVSPANQVIFESEFHRLPSKAQNITVTVEVSALANPLGLKVFGYSQITNRWSSTAITVMNPTYYMAYSFPHELGHQVEWQTMSLEQQADWASFWASHTSEMPTLYAKTTAYEGFAEVFSALFSKYPRYVKPDIVQKVHSYGF